MKELCSLCGEAETEYVCLDCAVRASEWSRHMYQRQLQAYKEFYHAVQVQEGTRIREAEERIRNLRKPTNKVVDYAG